MLRGQYLLEGGIYYKCSAGSAAFNRGVYLLEETLYLTMVQL